MKPARFVPDDINKEQEPFIPDPLSMRRKRVKLRTVAAVKRRRAYKARQPKRARIRCKYCNKRFVPKRVTKQFCCSNCAKQHHRIEWKLFGALGLVDKWNSLPGEIQQQRNRLTYLRAEYKVWVFGSRT